MAILIVDDEERDVDALVTLLQAGPGRRMDIDYVSSSGDAIPIMQERLISCGRPYRALITDHNMDELTGKQLLKVVTGSLVDLRREMPKLDRWNDVPDKELRTYLRETFGTVQGYLTFVRRHDQLIKILHSSNTYGDGNNDLPQNITFLQKPNAEQRILDVLCEEGAISERDVECARSDRDLSDSRD